MPKDHSYIFFHSGMYRDCDCPDHGQLFLTHHMQACWYSMHRSWISASLCDVPDVHIFSGYPFFSTDAASVSFFPISFLLSPDTQTRSHPHGFLPHILSELCVKTLRISPSAFHLYRAMLPLEPAYPSQYTVHPVFFTGEVDKLSSQDSSV